MKFDSKNYLSPKFAILILVLLGTMLFYWTYAQFKSEPTLVATNPKQNSEKFTTAQSPTIALLPSSTKISDSPDVATIKGKKFIDMSVNESSLILEAIEKQNMEDIFQRFIDAGRIERDLMKQSAIVGILGKKLKEQAPTTAFFEMIRRFVCDNSNSKPEREYILFILAQAKKKECAEFIVWVATAEESKDIRESATASISELRTKHENDYLIQLLKPIWQTSTNEMLLESIAVALAKDGNSSGVKLLLLAASAPDGQDDVRRKLSRICLNYVRDEKAVPFLAETLGSNDYGTFLNKTAFTILSRIYNDTGEEAMIKYFQTADESVIPLASEWIQNYQSSRRLEMLDVALKSNFPFQNEKVREALRVGLYSRFPKYNTNRN